MKIYAGSGGTAVEGVSKDGEAFACKVNAYLMGTACKKVAFEQKAFAIFYCNETKDFEIGAGALGVFCRLWLLSPFCGLTF